MLHYVTVCYVTICSGMFRYVPICSDIFRYVPICLDMLRYVLICSRMFRYVPWYLISSLSVMRVQVVPDNVPDLFDIAPAELPPFSVYFYFIHLVDEHVQGELSGCVYGRVLSRLPASPRVHFGFVPVAITCFPRGMEFLRTKRPHCFQRRPSRGAFLYRRAKLAT